MLASTGHLPLLTDGQIAAFDARPFDPKTAPSGRRVLGLHHGMTLVADYPCSDVCPDYTVRIIHYVHPAGPSCEAAGGVTRSEMVPVAIAETKQAFCEPAVIAKRKRT